jgi:hypothetical protein
VGEPEFFLEVPMLQDVSVSAELHEVPCVYGLIQFQRENLTEEFLLEAGCISISKTAGYLT